MYPKYDGRFPQVSGLKFKFDPDQPVGSRVVKDSLTFEDGSPIDLTKEYTLAAKNFIATGKDGYVAFTDKSIKHLKNDEQTI